MTYAVKEIFYTLQGEGANAGRPAGLGRLGFSYAVCKELNPRLVYASATGFGQDGPWAARPAFDEIIQAASGFASAMGWMRSRLLCPA